MDGDPGDLDRAIEYAEAAVAGAEAQRSGRLARYRLVLATVLGVRFDALGEIDDLDRGIEALERPVELDPLQEGRSADSTLGTMLRRRWTVVHDPDDLERAIELLGQTVELRDDATTPALLTNYGNALLDRYHERGDLDDLRRASESHERAVELTQPADWQLASRHNNAGNTALSSYELSGDPELLARAIEHYRRAIALTRPDAPERASRQYNLGNALRSSYEASEGEADATGARDAYREACEDGLRAGLQWALAAASAWGGWAAKRSAWAEAAAAYDYGLRAIDALVRRQLERDEKETWLEQSRGLAAEAGYALAMAGRRDAAAAAIELGRAFMLSEVLERDRAALADLERAGRGDLGERYRAASGRLRAATTGAVGRRG